MEVVKVMFELVTMFLVVERRMLKWKMVLMLLDASKHYVLGYDFLIDK